MESSTAKDVDIEMPSCQICQEEYGDENHPVVTECGHTMCDKCIQNLKNQQGSTTINCPTCRRECNADAPKNFKLEETISLLKKLRMKPENSVDCSKCSKNDNESEMFVCRDCVNDPFQYDVLGSINFQVELNIKSLAVCGTCAIRDHVSLRHEVISYFPLVSAQHFQSQLTSVGYLKEELEHQFYQANDTFGNFGATFHSFSQELEKMTEMIRKSRSSEVQQEFTNRINEEVRKFSEHMKSVSKAIAENQEKYEITFEKLVKKNREDEEEKCSELPERKFETACSECATKNYLDRLLCCKTCSEIVNQVIQDVLDSSDLDVVNTDTLPICSNCVINGHFGEDHKTVKFSVFQNKFDTLKRLRVVETQKDSLHEKFSALRDIYQHSIKEIVNYDDKIKKMWDITSESRGDPNHAHFVDGFQISLDQAERVVTKFQSNAGTKKKRIEDKKGMGDGRTKTEISE
ncbi:hypothetical protein GCK72_002124 [Caenorhabditis remanei]|uniref:RING-type domain-containing protein n=1 Tax=Caenorhabditis remanei TaxID=31234 RepID=A0A6A5HU60_CAERE|nr:hypothetical protein GCK72_002124 [Caenorhabditis remanei]KAF1770306.1 hypothetical protein GCK72_002124 [Caenorhabditis remanei]